LASVSRLITALVPREQYDAQSEVRTMMAKYREVQDMLMLGAYVRGSNQEFDRAIAMYPQIKEFCAQRIHEKVTYDDAVKTMKYLAGRE
jgi:flagellum-specific ATP synthase